MGNLTYNHTIESLLKGKIIETPGHTDGSLSVLLEDGSIFVGDAIMGGMGV